MPEVKNQSRSGSCFILLLLHLTKLCYSHSNLSVRPAKLSVRPAKLSVNFGLPSYSNGMWKFPYFLNGIPCLPNYSNGIPKFMIWMNGQHFCIALTALTKIGYVKAEKKQRQVKALKSSNKKKQGEERRLTVEQRSVFILSSSSNFNLLGCVWRWKFYNY
jgi:hypothetical protein